MAYRISSVEINYEDDVVTARQRARQVARALLFDGQDQTRISTAISEVARMFVNRRTPSHVEFFLEGVSIPQVLLVSIGKSREGGTKHSTPGNSANLSVFPAQWDTAMVSARRLMDQCEMRVNGQQEATVWLKKLLYKRKSIFGQHDLERLTRQIGSVDPQNPIEEVRQQNQELVRALEELHERQQELLRLNGELEDTNRGVVALYAELDEKADHLRRADEMKSRFLSNMSHEFRTPLNAIIALSQLLIDRADGDLNTEQAKQVGYIRKSGGDLLDLVNDLLDLAKIEAGKIEVRPSEFEVGNLFSALRGMLRPLLVSNTVSLIFDEPAGLPVLSTDEGKVSQIVRNFISNAIKFTERGEVRITARATDDGKSVVFCVADTGIGIAEEDQERIFQEFSQIDHPIQRRVKGTGLGLPLCRKLSELLGGSVSVSSRLGSGSTFSAVIPVLYAAKGGVNYVSDLPLVQPDETRLPVLVVEDEPETRLVYEKYLRRTPFQPIPAASIRQGRELLRRHSIVAIVLDIVLPDDTAWQWLAELKGDDATKGIPIFVVSAIDDPQKAIALGANDYCVKPMAASWLLERLERASRASKSDGQPECQVVLLIDDHEADRYLFGKLARETGFSVIEAPGGEEGLLLAKQISPSVIVLDLNMPRMDGFQVLKHLHDDLETRMIPVIVMSSQVLTPERRAALSHARVILEKSDLSPQSWKRAIQAAGCEIGPLPHGSHNRSMDR
ncbi:Histidine kinase [Nitrospira sp. KM1]|uniref:response regulator n=1 Tax=Nitrospira sp. KM1 TaxID=1936990 RepID=UPI0013A77D58|nr:response regulator [Nitrospira sp. KM1]BCA53326.1 Histidine kinase [Nitrospira sp. KM1]